MDITYFAKKKPYLFWSVREPEKLSNEAIVEAVLNDGDWDDVQKLFSILGIKKVAAIFSHQVNRRRVNYHPKIANYFRLYFNKHAH